MRRKKSELEAGLNGRIQRALSGRDPYRIENAVGPGTPDIAYVGGLIESKRLPAFPKKLDSVVKVPKYRPDQRAWHIRHRAAGGAVYVAIEIAATTFLFDAAVAAQYLGMMTRQQMAAKARFMCSPWDGKAFRKFIDTDKLPGIA